ncbi:MAG TPA: YraN family protein [Streptosporangiaceae bacterium]|nr:YraN family protein [Streptosporangiaceae bacterium]
MHIRRDQRGALGRRGEAAAADYLRRLGWTILDRNWRCRGGELDIVAYDGHRHVVCEVKTRSSARFGDPLEAITAAKAARLRRLAGRWAAQHGVSAAQIRIDVLGLVRAGPDAFEVDHCREVC